MKHARPVGKMRLVFVPVLCAVVLLLTCIVYAAASGTEKVRIADGADTYAFRTSATELEEILTKAEDHGFKPLEDTDYAEYDPETREVFVSRRIWVSITDGSTTLYTEAYSSSTVEEILNDNGIELKDTDVCIPKPDARVSGGATILVGTLEVDPSVSVTEDTVYMAEPLRSSIVRLDSSVCEVLVKVNDDVLHLEVNSGMTVGEVLKEHHLSPRPGDEVNLPLDTPVQNETVILMKRVVYVNMKADGENTRVGMVGGTVADALALGKIELDEDDRISHALDANVSDEMEIVINRVEYVDRMEKEEIPFEVVETKDDSLFTCNREVTVKGENGTQAVLYRDCFVDGVLESTRELSKLVTKEPVTEEVTVGTQIKRAIKAQYEGGTTTDAYGNTITYSCMYVGSGTAYYGGGICSTGVPAQVGVVAVDPEIIPYGSRLYIASCDGSGVYGYCIAGDTGGFAWNESAICDLYYDTYDECVQFGRRDIMVYVLE